MKNSEQIQPIISTVSVNDNVFHDTFSEISSRGDSVPQPIMILGEEGSGKTTLLRRLYESSADRPRIWIDGRTLFSTDNILKAGNITNNSILFIDDIDFYLTRCSYDEQYRLRRLLYNEGAPMLISTVRKILPAISEYNAPFFEGLRLIYINPISVKDVSSLFKGHNFDRAIALMNFLPPTIKSIKIIYDIIQLNDNPDRDNDYLLSIFSDKYRRTYENLPTNSQRILNSFGPNDTGLTIPELKNKNGLSTGILSAYLTRLREIGIISADKSIKKNTKYSIKDPLFKIWLSQTTQPRSNDILQH